MRIPFQKKTVTGKQVDRLLQEHLAELPKRLDREARKGAAAPEENSGLWMGSPEKEEDQKGVRAIYERCKRAAEGGGQPTGTTGSSGKVGGNETT